MSRHVDSDEAFFASICAEADEMTDVLINFCQSLLADTSGGADSDSVGAMAVALMRVAGYNAAILVQATGADPDALGQALPLAFSEAYASGLETPLESTVVEVDK